MKTPKIIARESLNEMLKQEMKSKKDYLDWLGEKDIDGKFYSVWEDTRTGETYAVKTLKGVNMGFNTIEKEAVAEVIETVEKYGDAKARWGVTGRTMHSLLAQELSRMLPQYRFEIGDNYECYIYKK